MATEVRYAAQREYIISEILAQQQPTRSGISYKYGFGNKLGFYPPAELPVDNGVSTRAFVRDYTGGSGITCRSLEQLVETMPEVGFALSATAGKVIFLGNGFSPVPLTVVERFKQGELSAAPVIVDAYDYQKVEDDLLALEATANMYGVCFQGVMGQPLGEILRYVISLNREVAAGNLVAVNYFLGQKTPPTILQGADVIINCFGPPAKTLREQLSMLALGGHLYFKQLYTAQIPEGYCKFSDVNVQRVI